MKKTIAVAWGMILPVFLSGFYGCSRKEAIHVSGSTTVLPLVSKAAERFQTKHPEVHIIVNAGGSGVELPRSFFEPVTALPTHILALAQQATHPQALQNAWGASLVLIGLVMVFSILGWWGRRKLRTVSQR